MKANKYNQAGEDLANSFKDHKFIFDNLNDIVWAITWPDLKVQFINKVVKDIIGYSAKEFRKDPFLMQKITHPDDKKINKKAFRDLKENGYAEREIRIISKKGELKWLYNKWKMIYDQDNNPVRVEGIIRDITKRKKAEEKLKYNENRYQTIFNSVPVGIMVEDEKGNILEVNQVLCEKSGYSREELIGSSVLEKFVLPEDHEFAKKNIKRVIKGEDVEFDVKTPTKDGQIKHYHLKETDIDLANGGKGIISMHLDISEMIKKEKQIEYLAYRDSLTDLYNRKFFEAELQRVNIKNELPLSIIMGDLNGLKIINNSYGHKKGDKLLIETAKILKEIERKEDVLARYGGDEFIMLLPQTTKNESQKIIDKIKAKINKEMREIPLSLSMGVATKSSEKLPVTELLKKAEDKMHQNKLSESKSSKSDIVRGLLNTLNAKSSETKEHALRMSNLAVNFGKKLELSNFELNRLSLLATLHDIGKTTISEAILKKPGKLNAQEWKMIKEHPEIGYKIASSSKEFDLVADEILSHHEKWNGSGYPNGLKKEKIPYLARIIAIIDSYDVMTNDRPYSKAISKTEALAEIKGCAGSQFDPNLAEAFVKMMDN